MGFEPIIHFMKEMHGKMNLNLGGTFQGSQSMQQVAYLRQLQRDMKKEETLLIPLNELDIVVFDIETTGFYPGQGDTILSIGAVKVSGGSIKEEDVFYSLVRYENPLTSEIQKLTGIDEMQLRDAPLLADVLIDFFKFVRELPLVAHHATHEKNFLQHASWKLFKAPFKHRIIDTSFLYRIADPSMEHVTLEDCCEHNQIQVKDRHHALGDAKLAAKLWCIYIPIIQKLGCETLRDLYERLAKV
ncbi:exonuclease domain-containing protein [Metabacillus herbersteinensis]|uniref:Exonuclease domain-containing protein n=1 Tax=Metabacillus herbersteinensis TaxID=283816 RepID=A0ABV6GN46_9BACI